MIEDDYLKFLREQILHKYRDTVFRPNVWPDPPIRGPHGLAENSMKPGVVPHSQRPFSMAGYRRDAMIEIIDEFESLGLIEPSDPAHG